MDRDKKQVSRAVLLDFPSSPEVFAFMGAEHHQMIVMHLSSVFCLLQLKRMERISSILAEAKQIARVVVQVGRVIAIPSVSVPSHLLQVIDVSSVQESRFSSVDCKKESQRLMVKLRAIDKVIVYQSHSMSVQINLTLPFLSS